VVDKKAANPSMKVPLDAYLLKEYYLMEVPLDGLK